MSSRIDALQLDTHARWQLVQQGRDLCREMIAEQVIEGLRTGRQVRGCWFALVNMVTGDICRIVPEEPAIRRTFQEIQVRADEGCLAVWVGWQAARFMRVV